MADQTVTYDPIGEIRTEFDSPEGMPIQPAGTDVVGTVVIDPAYRDGLTDLDGFSHCILLYHFHAAADDVSMAVEPFLDDTERGLFATRAPNRPNGIGLSIVEIESIEDTELTVSGVDVVDGTPLLDIKPFVSPFDVPADTEEGWLADCEEAVRARRADDRFL